MLLLQHEAKCVNCGDKYKTIKPNLAVKYKGNLYMLDLCILCATYSVINLDEIIKACTKKTKGWDVVIKGGKKDGKRKSKNIDR